MLDEVTGFECWLIDEEGGRLREYKTEAIVAKSPPVSTRVRAVTTSRLSGSSTASVSTYASSYRPPYTPFSAPKTKPDSLFTSDQESLPIVRCYVQVVPLRKFAVHFQESRNATFALAVEVILDGRFARGRFRRGPGKADFNICRKTVDGSPVSSPLEFPDLCDIEDTLSLADEELGTVCVDVWRGNSRNDLAANVSWNSSIMTTADAEDVLTPRPVRGGPPVYLRGGTAFDPLMNFEFQQRLVRFEFRYRTEAFLRLNHIKPSPKPKSIDNNRRRNKAQKTSL